MKLNNKNIFFAQSNVQSWSLATGGPQLLKESINLEEF